MKKLVWSDLRPAVEHALDEWREIISTEKSYGAIAIFSTHIAELAEIVPWLGDGWGDTLVTDAEKVALRAFCADERREEFEELDVLRQLLED